MPNIPYEIRNYHVNIIGNTGVGKSSLITWWAFNDIKSREGAVCVIDPKGDLVRDIMRVMPDDRIADCIHVDIDDPAPLDFLRCAPGNEDDVVHDLKFMLMGEAMDNTAYPIINKNIETLLYSLISANSHPEFKEVDKRRLKCTFLDVGEFWENEERRDFIIDHITDPRLKAKWKKLPSESDREKITNRISPFILSSALSKIFGDPNPRLDLDEIIKNKKILLLSVPVERYASAAYGKFLMAKIQHAMFSVKDPEKRLPLFLYCDEFQNFPTSEHFDRVVDMGRGYLLCFTLSVTRLERLSASMVSALGIIGSYIVFQMNVKDRPFYETKVCREDPNRQIREKEDNAYLDWQISRPRDDGEDRPYYKWAALQKIAANLPAPPVSVNDLASLRKYEAIYKIGDEPSVIEPTPTPLPKELTPEQQRKLAAINEASKFYRSSYLSNAQSGTIRTIPNSSCNTPAIPHTEANGSTNPDKAEQTEGGGAPTPHERRQKRKP
jgi:hypothetical protein